MAFFLSIMTFLTPIDADAQKRVLLECLECTQITDKNCDICDKAKTDKVYTNGLYITPDNAAPYVVRVPYDVTIKGSSIYMRDYTGFETSIPFNAITFKNKAFSTGAALPSLTRKQILDGILKCQCGAAMNISIEVDSLAPLTAGNCLTFTDAQFNQVTWCETESTLVDNGDGTWTYTSEYGNQSTFQEGWTVGSVDADNDLILTYPDGTTFEWEERISTLVDNGNGTLTYTDENLQTTTFQEGWTTVTDNGNATWTYTYPDGTTEVFDFCAIYDQSTCKPTLSDNGDGTFTFDDGFGDQTTFPGGWTTVTVNADNSITFNYPDGTSSNYDETLTTLVDNGDGTATYTNESGIPVTIQTGWTVAQYNSDGTWTYTYPDGITTTLDICLIMSDGECLVLADNGDGTSTLQYNTGKVIGTVATGATIATLDAANNILTITMPDGSSVVFDEVNTTLVDNGNGTLTYTNEAGATTTFQSGWTTVAVNPTSNQLTFTYPDGTTVSYNETVTTLTNPSPGLYTYTSEDGTTTDICYTIQVNAGTGDIELLDCAGNLVSNIDIATEICPLCVPAVSLSCVDDAGPTLTVGTPSTNFDVGANDSHVCPTGPLSWGAATAITGGISVSNVGSVYNITPPATGTGGAYSFQYTVTCPDDGSTCTGTVTGTTNPPANVMNCVDDSGPTLTDGGAAQTINVSNNDGYTCGGGGTVSYSAPFNITGPITAAYATSDVYTITPTGGTGAYSFEYTVTCSTGGSCTAVVTGTVDPPANAMTCNDDLNVDLVDGGSNVTVDVATNDTYTCSGTVSWAVSGITGPVNVTMSGSVATVSSTGGSGAWSATITATCSTGGSCTSTLSGNVTAGNSLVCNDDTGNDFVDGGNITVDVTANDSYTCSGTISWSAPTVNLGPVSAVHNGGGSYTITSTGGTGIYQVGYTVTCSTGGTCNALIIGTISSGNAMACTDDSGPALVEGGAAGTPVDVATNDSYTCSGTVSHTLGTVTGPVTASISGSSVTITPNATGTGAYSVAYTATCSTGGSCGGVITGTVASGNSMVCNDDTGITVSDTGPAVVVDVAANDAHSCSGSINFLPAFGTTGPVSVSNSGSSYTITPTGGTGAWSFTYQAGCTTGGSCSALVSGTVVAGNSLTCVDDTGNDGVENGPDIIVDPGTNDTYTCGGGGTITYTIGSVTGPVTAVVNGGDIEITPDPVGTGAYSVEYTATCSTGGTCSAFIFGDITAANSMTCNNDSGPTFGVGGAAQSIDVTTNDSYTCSGTVSYSAPLSISGPVTVTHTGGGVYQITPNASGSGAYSFDYIATCSTGGTCNATVSGTITPNSMTCVNDSGPGVTIGGASANIDVTTNDSYTCSGVVSYSAPLSISGDITVSHLGSGVYQVTPNGTGSGGAYSFDYIATCSTGSTCNATVSGTVTGAAPPGDLMACYTGCPGGQDGYYIYNAVDWFGINSSNGNVANMAGFFGQFTYTGNDIATTVTGSLDFGDGTAPTPITVNGSGASNFGTTHTYTTAGTYTITFSFTSDSGLLFEIKALYITDAVGGATGAGAVDGTSGAEASSLDGSCNATNTAEGTISGTGASWSNATWDVQLNGTTIHSLFNPYTWDMNTLSPGTHTITWTKAGGPFTATNFGSGNSVSEANPSYTNTMEFRIVCQ